MSSCTGNSKAAVGNSGVERTSFPSGLTACCARYFEEQPFPPLARPPVDPGFCFPLFMKTAGKRAAEGSSGP